MCCQSRFVDDIIFRQLKESRYYHPEITEVMFDSNMLQEMIFDSMSIVEKGYDTVWDSGMLNFALKYFRDVFDFIESQIKDMGLQIRIIVESTKENTDRIKFLNNSNIRCLGGVKGNFGIFDNRAYMVYIFHQKTEKPDQTLWSNSKVLVEKQQAIFNKMWELSIPLSNRIKELEFEDNPDFKKIFFNRFQIQNAINSSIEHSRKELLLISSSKILNSVTYHYDIWSHLSALQKKGILVKVLVDDINSQMIQKIKKLNKQNSENIIQFRYTDKLGRIDELAIIKDGLSMIQLRLDVNQNLVATLSNERNKILVQQILFEKFWNETNSLMVLNSNSD